jgi:hypothetical protein
MAYHTLLTSEVWLVRTLMDKYSISIFKMMAKNCPKNFSKRGWNEFINQIQSGCATTVTAS